MDAKTITEFPKKRKRERAWTDGEYLYVQASGRCVYDIPLSRMRTAPQVLDWIHQVIVGKNWGPEVARDMLEVIFYEIIPTKMWSGKA